MSGTFSNELPHDVSIEAAFVSAVFHNPEILIDYSFIKPEYFLHRMTRFLFEDFHRRIYSNHSLDYLIIKSELDKNPLFEEAGGNKTLDNILKMGGLTIQVPDYVKKLQELYKRRIIMIVCETAYAEAQANPVAWAKTPTPGEVIDNLMSTLGELDAVEVREKTDWKSTLKRVAWEQKQPTPNVTISTGLNGFDNIIGGLRASNLEIIAGRPSMGKTAAAVHLLKAAVQAGKIPGFVSLEMSADQLVERYLSDSADLDFGKIVKRQLDASELSRFISAAQYHSNFPVELIDTPSATMDQICSKARRSKARGRLDLLIIDYLQIIKMDDRYAGNKNNEVSECTRRLKQLAKELNVPVVVLSQLSRGVEGREDKRPTLADLRDSGSIEQDADTVTFLYREEYYLQKSIPSQRSNESAKAFQMRQQDWANRMRSTKNMCEWIVQKNRHGDVGTAKTFFERTKMRFQDLSSSIP